MKTLKAICHLPFVTASGEIIASPGFHEGSAVYTHFEADAVPPLPDNPDRGQIVAAIKTAMQPWSGYRFATPEDRAAMLAGIMTAVCRPALDIAPGVFFDAPVQASGKTKAAGALGALMKGRRAGVTPYVSGQNAEAELLKKLVAVCVVGETFMLFDNVVGTWRSAVLAAMITEGQINERLLGANQWHRGAARMMVCATGNNASLDLDLGRRFLRVRIDPGVECPQARSFAFDPVDTALASRLAIAHAVLVLVTAYQVAGSPVLGRGDAGFADWNRLVRRTILWLQAEGYAEDTGFGPMGDPAHSILDAAAADDPETEAARMLLQGLNEAFQNECFMAKDVYALYTIGRGDVFEALHAILGRRDVSAVSVGRVLLNRRDKIVGGLVLRRIGETRQGATWWVQSV